MINIKLNFKNKLNIDSSNSKSDTDDIERSRKKLNTSTKKIIIITVAIIMVIMILLYIIGNNAYNQKKEDTNEDLPKATFIETFQYAFDFKYSSTSFMTIGAMGAAIFFLIVSKKGKGKNNETRNFKISDKDTYGTAEKLSLEGMKETLRVVPSLENEDGIILGMLRSEYGKPSAFTLAKSFYVVLPVEPMKTRKVPNYNTMVYGSAGTRKSRSFVRPFAMQAVKRGESLVFNDPSGEMESDLRAWLESKGYVCKSLNVVDPSRSNSWNFLNLTYNDPLLLQVIAQSMIDNTGGDKPDVFFDSGESSLLEAIMLYVQHNDMIPDNDKNFPTCYDILIDNNADELEIMFQALPRSHPAKDPYLRYSKKSSLSDNFIQGLATRLKVFGNTAIKPLFARNDIDIELLGKQKCAYFIITPDQNSTFDFIPNLFISTLFEALANYAKKQPYKLLPVPVNLVLDEFANTGVYQEFGRKIATCRKYDIRLHMIIQSISQLQDRYPGKKWEDIINNCATEIFLGCNEETTARYVSNRSGDATVEVSSKQADYGIISTPNKETSSVGKRMIYTEHEVRTLDINKAIVMMFSKNIYEVDKFDYSDHPYYNEMSKFENIDATAKLTLSSDYEDKINSEKSSTDFITKERAFENINPPIVRIEDDFTQGWIDTSTGEYTEEKEVAKKIAKGVRKRRTGL